MSSLETLSTRAVCERLGISEDGLRHGLRRPGAPRPQLHPTAQIFLWTEADVQALAEFLGRTAIGSPTHADQGRASP